LFLCGCMTTLPIPLGWEGGKKGDEIIKQLLMNNEKVSLVIYGGHVSLYGRIDTTRRGQQRWEPSWLTSWRFYEFPNFSLVNPFYFESIVDELFLPRCGPISENTRIIVGNMTGATHIQVIHLLYFGHRWYREMTVYFTLTEIQSGKILAIDRYKMRFYP
jgi:hypothetical protein